MAKDEKIESKSASAAAGSQQQALEENFVPLPTPDQQIGITRALLGDLVTLLHCDIVAALWKGQYVSLNEPEAAVVFGDAGAASAVNLDAMLNARFDA